ncbi:sensor domain-containing diguanylate cyclase [Halobacillus sp. BBL2006]|uniref:sensor domain-containing diguanylate cyclase n=1 Tax=Halobacillus sp. BBL2006 TaxID=1543706 RepID=UPI000541E10C|nr:sensor domain-containing diguanylate cyclase [Halobacillus sp. BBL2006]KHE72623.1 hypothetical protein LD39_03580 [Halobacillus sp. BBL2006]
MNGIHHLMTNNSALENVIQMTQDSIAIIERRKDCFVYTYMNESMKTQFGNLLDKEIYEAHPYQVAHQLSLSINSLEEGETSDLQTFLWPQFPFYDVLVHVLNKSTAYLIMVKQPSINHSTDREQSLEPFQDLVEMSPDSIFVHDKNGCITYVNTSGLRLLGALKKTEVVGRIFSDLLSENYPILSRVKKLSSESVKGSPIEGRIRRLDGTLIDVEMNSGLIDYPQSEAVQIVCRNITERKEQLNQLEEMAYYDQLTKVSNRRYFFKQLQIELEEVDKNQSLLSVLFIDLDNFKEINDQFGHQIGDEVLVIFTKRVKQMLRSTDTFSRLGGDEFVVLLSNLQSANDPQAIANRMMECITQPISINGQTLYISVSIGIASYPEQGTSREMLLTNADQALYEAKKKGRKCVEVYRL